MKPSLNHSKPKVDSAEPMLKGSSFTQAKTASDAPGKSKSHGTSTDGSKASYKNALKGDDREDQSTTNFKDALIDVKPLMEATLTGR